MELNTISNFISMISKLRTNPNPLVPPRKKNFMYAKYILNQSVSLLFVQEKIEKIYQEEKNIQGDYTIRGVLMLRQELRTPFQFDQFFKSLKNKDLELEILLNIRGIYNSNTLDVYLDFKQWRTHPSLNPRISPNVVREPTPTLEANIRFYDEKLNGEIQGYPRIKWN
ncbi:hypothetical protein J4408_02595 [Candidatus Pacearchaeota archaeon]|nr:hypothetical protein [Candidatus Pacearchaeota archaeon]